MNDKEFIEEVEKRMNLIKLSKNDKRVVKKWVDYERLKEAIIIARNLQKEKLPKLVVENGQKIVGSG